MWDFDSNDPVHVDDPRKSMTESEALIQFFTLSHGADVTCTQIDYAPGGPLRWSVMTIDDFAKLGPNSPIKRTKPHYEVWYLAEGPEGEDAELAVRDLLNGEIWLFNERVLDRLQRFFDEREYFRCLTQRPLDGGQSEIHLVPKRFDCRTCPKHLACVTKGWMINVV